MGETLTEVEFAEALRSFRQTAFRLELQPTYHEPSEQETVAKFLAGTPEPPTEVVELRAWFDQVSELTRQGKRIARVRVHEEPPTDYQRWERWIGAWNTAAGETIGYLTRSQAHEIELLPAAGNVDWWLLDSNRLVTMHFDDHGRRIRNELITDRGSVQQARVWRDLAVAHSAVDHVGDVTV